MFAIPKNALSSLSIGSALSIILVSTALAAGSHGGGHGHGDGHGAAGGHHGAAMNIGEPGTADAVDRIINITMYDNYYEPESLDIKPGETIRFVVKNAGDAVHEFGLGTAAMHNKHKQEMARMVESGALDYDKIHYDKMGHGAMGHDDPNSVLLEPGQSGEIIWTFSKQANIEFACNVPGHYESGMMGPVKMGHAH